MHCNIIEQMVFYWLSFFQSHFLLAKDKAVDDNSCGCAVLLELASFLTAAKHFRLHHFEILNAEKWRTFCLFADDTS